MADDEWYLLFRLVFWFYRIFSFILPLPRDNNGDVNDNTMSTGLFLQ